MRYALASILVLTLPMVFAVAEEPPPGGPPQMPPVAVEVTAVKQMEVPGGRTFTGTVEPSRVSVVGSQFGGLVEAYLCRDGQRVEAGQPLARLDPAILDLKIEAAEADRDLGQKRLDELENGSRPEEIEQARARVAELEAGLELREWKLEATKKLFEDSTISEDELRDARLAVKASQLLLNASRSALALVEAGPRAEQVEQARAQLKRLDAEVRRLGEEKLRYTIKAPFAGWIVKEYAEEGQWLSTGSPVVEVAALDKVDIVVNVVEDFVGGLRPGLDVRLAFDAIPGRLFTGTIHRIVPSADRRGRTFPVKVRVTNERVGEGVLLKAGMFANATLAVGEKRQALFVPKDAIVLGGPVPVMVWAVGEDATAQLVPVGLGVAVDDLVEVIGPLQPGMQVVVKGNERIYMPGRQLVLPGAKPQGGR